MRSMVTRVAILSGYGAVRHVRVSLPLIPCLVDRVRYMLPEDAQPDSIDDRIVRRQQACGFTRAIAGKKPRAPTLRTLVRYALKCQSAEELGEGLRARYERQQRRAGLATGRPRQDVELDSQLDKLLQVE
jgi:hypothetical protein